MIVGKYSCKHHLSGVYNSIQLVKMNGSIELCAAERNEKNIWFLKQMLARAAD